MLAMAIFDRRFIKSNLSNGQDNCREIHTNIANRWLLMIKEK